MRAKAKALRKSSKKSKAKLSADEKEWKKQLKSAQSLQCKIPSDFDLCFDIKAVTNQVGEAVIFTRGLRSYGLLDQIAIGVPKKLLQDVAETMNVIVRFQLDRMGASFLVENSPSIQYRGLFLKLHPTRKDEGKFVKNKFDISVSTSGKMILLLPRFAGASTWGGLPDAPAKGFEIFRNYLLFNPSFVHRHYCCLTDFPLNNSCKIKVHCPHCESKEIQVSCSRKMNLNDNECIIYISFHERESPCGCDDPYHWGTEEAAFPYNLNQKYRDHFWEHERFYGAFRMLSGKGKTVQELLNAFWKGTTKQAIDSSYSDEMNYKLDFVAEFISKRIDPESNFSEDCTKKKKNPRPIQLHGKKSNRRNNIDYSNERSGEKAKKEHSKRLGLVLDEARDMFKDIRIKIADNALKKDKPKTRTQHSSQLQPFVPSFINNPESIGLGGKAGKVSFIVRIGEETALYKTMKPQSERAAFSNTSIRCYIDLHGYTVEEGRAALDRHLPEWYKMAMESGYPFVIKVKIICGGGAQLLSEMIEGWIRSSRVVAKAIE